MNESTYDYSKEEEVGTMSDSAERPGSGRRPRLYNRLRLLRYEADLSRKELGESLGVSAAAIRSIERDGMEPGLVLAWRISRYFDCPLELIFSEDPLPPISQLISRCGSHTQQINTQTHDGERENS